ncbi:MAG: hypothetical protein ACRDYA_04300 [Egibacteraceae bacterium]
MSSTYQPSAAASAANASLSKCHAAGLVDADVVAQLGSDPLLGSDHRQPLLDLSAVG